MTVQAFVFRITGGRLMGKLRGMDICVVKTTGAKSGKIRYIPLMLVPYEEGVILVASMGGRTCPSIMVLEYQNASRSSSLLAW